MAIGRLIGNALACGAMRRVAGLLAVLCMAAVPAAAADEGGPLKDALRAEIELLQVSGRTSYSELEIVAPALVAEIYATRQYAPLWTTPARRQAVAETLRAAVQDGLDPRDYHLERIERTLATEASGRELTRRGAAAFEVLVTDGLVRLAHDLHYGRLTEGWPSWRPGMVATDQDVISALSTLLVSESLSSAMLDWLPASERYLRLRAALTRYRVIAVQGGWPALPPGPTIRAGSVDPRIDLLARRLAVSGDLEAPPAGGAETYGPVLEAAVRRFQERHGIAVDGEVGGATLGALNVPVTVRIDQLRVNLERERWPRDPVATHRLVVNIPAFRAELPGDGREPWSVRVIVGEPDTPTPTLESAIRNIVLNPTWTVPYSIASRELLPEIQADADFLRRGGYDVLDRNGAAVDPGSVDWAALGPDRFPYTLLQRPGPANALGRVKFVFPNDHGVRMHDTPTRQLFARPHRALSHGCIRVDDPEALAARLAAGEGWSRARIEEQLGSLETRSIFLSDPVPLSVVYRTVEVDDAGRVHFHADIYDRDPAVLAALEAGLLLP